MVPLALGPSLFRSQHFGELGQQIAFFLPNEHGDYFLSVCLPMAVPFFAPLWVGSGKNSVRRSVDERSPEDLHASLEHAAWVLDQKKAKR
jgi:hypothetical protein